MSEIFRRHHSKAEQHAKDVILAESDSNSGEDVPGIGVANEEEKQPLFAPRQVSLTQMLDDPQAPWRHYRPIRGAFGHWGIRHTELADVEFSRSMSFLLDVGSQLIDIQPEILYKQLLRVEASFVDTVKGLKRLDGFMSA